MGLPEQIYFDHGGENIGVKSMLDTYNTMTLTVFLQVVQLAVTNSN